MSYKFIKENIRNLIDGQRVDKSTLEVLIEGRDNSFILNHNIDAISAALSFLNGADNIFVLNGFMGSGKTFVADFVLDFINDDVLVFKNSYQEAINPDDVLLSLFKDFSTYHNDKKIELPKSETSVFSEKINNYIKSCNKPMLFIFDSFEINMKSKDTQKDILDFINYLSHFEKIKIIICSRTFKEDDLISKIGATSYNLTSLSKAEVYVFLDENKIEGSTYEKDELFKVTRGHYLLLELSVLIMSITGLSLTLFSTEYKKSTKNFLEFLISKILLTTSDKFIKILLFLSTLRHGVSIDFLLSQEIATFEDIDFLIQKRAVAEKFNKYYLKDYLKNEFIKNINLESRIKVHKFIIDLYESELPLKPFERILFLSRQTMRQEIAYHQNKIKSLSEDLIKSGKTKLPETQDFNYLSYSRTSGYEKKEQQKKELQKRYTDKIKNKRKNQMTQSESLFLTSMNSEDMLSKNLMEISDLQKEEININEEQNLEESVPDSLEDYIEIAQNYEKAYNYTNAILYYKKALSYKFDLNYEEKEPLLYQQLAYCYKKIQDIEEAKRLYEKVYEIFAEKSAEKANEILLTMARMYSELYKFDVAKEYYKRILYSGLGVTTEMVVRVYLDLSEIEDNNSDIESAIKYAQKALTEAEKITDIKLLAECCFKYALLLDDTNNIEMATKYYQRCVKSANDPEVNIYMASAYSNLAEISAQNNNTRAAKMYYELSIDADKKHNNIEGLYYSYLKLSELYKNENPEKTYELLLKALSAAKRFDDINYSISIYIEIGDYYLSQANYKQGLKSYILAKRLTPEHATDDVNSKINIKINRVKSMLGEEKFLQLIDEIKKKK